jgi:hypothetical protein
LRKSLTHYGLQYFYFKIWNHCSQLFYCLTSPTIGTDDGDEFKVGSKGIR